MSESTFESSENGWPRIVIHADMDAFYASVEQLDNADLRGKPVLVGPRSRRGVVLTASYEARPYRVGSAMAMSKALQRCPQAIVVPPRFKRYAQISKQIMDVFDEFSPEVEALSLDEAFLEMTGSVHIFGPPQQMGEQLRAAVREATGLEVSVGIAASKYVAKVASSTCKPRGLQVVTPDMAKAWLAPMPVSRMWGAGPKTQARLHSLGYSTIGDIAATSPDKLASQLGNMGTHFHELANARDPRRVHTDRTARSIGSERTLSEDVSARSDIERYLKLSADKVARRLRANNLVAGGVQVKLKTSGFRLLTRQISLAEATDVAECLSNSGIALLDRFDDVGPFRLIGLAAHNLQPQEESGQLDLLGDNNRRRLETTLDELATRFGDRAIRRAVDITSRGAIDLENDLP